MLSADQRLRSNRDFRRAYARGRSHVNQLAVLYVAKRGGDVGGAGPRFGFVVSKKQGKANVRNRIKRRMREAVRLRLGDLTARNVDVVVVGRSGLRSALWPEALAAMDDLLRKSGLDSGKGRSDAT